MIIISLIQSHWNLALFKSLIGRVLTDPWALLTLLVGSGDVFGLNTDD